MKTSVGVLILAIALSVTSCGGDDPPTSASGSGDGGDTAESAAAVDPCTLLTADEVASVTGRRVDDGELSVLTYGDQCLWRTFEGTAMTHMSAQTTVDSDFTDQDRELGVSVASNFAYEKDRRENAKNLDLGDEAFVDGGHVEVLKDGVAYVFDMGGSSPKWTSEVQELAGLALD